MVKKHVSQEEFSKENSVIYQAKNGAIELRGDFSRETIWATQAEIVALFGVDQSVVSRHIRNMFKEEEVDPKSNMQKMHIANSDRPTNLYSLDVILGVGYRTNSGQAIVFRRWATGVLRQHIVEGYTINRSRIGVNYDAFLKAVDEIKHFLPRAGLSDAVDVVELVRMFAATWVSLDAYDKSDLPTSGATRSDVFFTAQELWSVLANLKKELVARGEASDLFGAERFKGDVTGIVGNVFQSFGGIDVYPTIEEKAAHLLYFLIKNHPFSDGNKRSGAFSFIWFLKSAKLLDAERITPEALTVLTLLVAESDPREKERIIGLVLLLLRKSNLEQKI